tara:strand:+ start:383 stop:685 length:303 start_codon:yes stop_codon:yes gene_type:complete
MNTYLAFNTGRYYGGEEGQPIEAALLSTLVYPYFDDAPEMGGCTLCDVVFYDRVRGLAYTAKISSFTEKDIMQAYDSNYKRRLNIISIDEAVTLIEEAQV